MVKTKHFKAIWSNLNEGYNIVDNDGNEIYWFYRDNQNGDDKKALEVLLSYEKAFQVGVDYARGYAQDK